MAGLIGLIIVSPAVSDLVIYSSCKVSLQFTCTNYLIGQTLMKDTSINLIHPIIINLAYSGVCHDLPGFHFETSTGLRSSGQWNTGWASDW